MKPKKTAVRVRETKTAPMSLRILPSVKRHLEALSDATGYTMSSILEFAILKITVEDFKNCAVCKLNLGICECEV